MVGAASAVINALPQVDRYLELGAGRGSTFRRVAATEKVGVDVSGGDGVLTMTTDEFFREYSGPSFDVVFIDADHEAQQTLRDYNNSITVLSGGGVILLHDMVPPEEAFIASNLCGDVYRLLSALVQQEQSMLVLDHDFGLTIVFNPLPVRALPDLSFHQFHSQIFPRIPIVNLPEMIAKVRE